MGGVVNFILKSDYEGFTAGGRVGTATDYNEGSGYATGGTKIGPVSLVATVSFTRTDPLFQNERAFSSPFYGHLAGTNVPGVAASGAHQLSPALNSPSQKNPTGANATAGSLANLVSNGTYLPTTATQISKAFDLSPYQTLLTKQNVGSFALSMDAPLIDAHRLDAFENLLISQGQSFTRWAPVPQAGITVPADAPFNPLTTAFLGVSFTDLSVPHDFFNTMNPCASRRAYGGRSRTIGIGKVASYTAKVTCSSANPA